MDIDEWKQCHFYMILYGCRLAVFIGIGENENSEGYTASRERLPFHT